MTRYFKKYSLHYRSLLAMGVPIMVGQLGVILTGFVDNIMVGHHTTAELSAASFVNNIFMLPLMFATGFAMGITPLIGEQTGRNELPQAGQIFRYGLFANGILAASLILIMGTLYFFLDRMGLPQELLPLMRPYYLLHLIGLVPVLLFNAFKQFADGTTDTLTPMFILLSSNLLNIIGNTVLIYGYAGFPEWGLFGAGVSTLTARIFTIVAGLCIFMYRKRYRRFKSGFFRLPSNRKLYRPILTMGIPVALQLGMETGSFSLSVIFIGWIGSTALAAHQAAVTFSTIGFLLYSGIGAAVTILISNARGSNRDHEIRPIATAGIHIVLGLILGRYRYHVFCPPTHRIYFYRLARRRYARIGDCHTDDCLSTGRWPANHSCRSITRTRSSKTDGMDRFHQLFYSQPSRLLLFCIPMSGRCTGSLVGLSRGTQLRSPAFLLAIPSEQQT